MNSKDLSEEVKDALKYTVFANIPSKISVVLYFKMERFCLENQILALKTNVPLHKELSNALYKQESIEVSNAKIAAHIPNFLQIMIFVNI